MELLYVWIEEHNCIKNQGFNFSPHYEFLFTPYIYKHNLENILEGELIKRDLTPKTEDHFFGEHISNITAIVGKNGTGKSSLIKKVFSFSELSGSSKNCIFILRTNKSELFLYITCNPNYINIEKNFACEIKYYLTQGNFNENLKDTSFIYLNHALLSSDFGRAHNPENDKSINLSSYYILSNNGFNKTSNIEIYQQLNVLLNNIFLKNISINIPNELVISIDTNYRNDHDGKISSEITQFFDNQFREENIIRRGDANFKAFILMPLFYLLFDHKGLDKSITQDIFLKLKDSNNEIFDFIYLCLDEIEEKIKEQEVSPRVSYQVRRIKHIREFLEKNKIFCDYMKKHNIIKEKHGGAISENVFRNGSFIIKLSKDGQYNYELIKILCDLFSYTSNEIDTYVKDIFPHNYIQLSWWQFSSGEQVMLNTFSRLYHIRNKVIDNQIILLIDEGELYLHPQWQKRYISDLIDSLKLIFENRKIQIILTSHSPFIISDLPKEHVIFLDKDDNGNCKVVSGIEKQQTFGANIHTLFAEAFFLEDGLIGDFAKQKINEVIKELKNNPTQEKIEKAKNFISLIGEPVLRRKMTQLIEDVDKR